MKVGIYLDVRNPPGERRDWQELYATTLDHCERADELGAASIWFSEHHGFADGYLSQPLVLAAAAAGRTRRARLGTAVLLAPLRPAALIAEEAALVDVLSGGRFDLGLGAGYRAAEFDLYGADVARRYGETDARVREVRRLWADDSYLPSPVQRRLPIWLGYTGPQGAARAGRLGEGLLAVDPSLLAPYRAGLVEGGHDQDEARMSGVVYGFVTDDPDRDWPTVAAHVAYQADSYRIAADPSRRPPPIDPDAARARGIRAGRKGFLYGTPEHVAGELRHHLAGLPVDTVFLWASVGGMGAAMTGRHIETICTRLAPLLADA